MSSSKIIQIKEFNGIEYTNLYPMMAGVQVNVTLIGAGKGIAVTATQDSDTRTAITDDNGKAILYLTLGDWEISANTYSRSITVAEYKIYDIVLGIDNTLEDSSWATIKTISDTGAASSVWSIGDTKSIKFSGTIAGRTFDETLYVYIIGFDHNSEIEGNGIAFQGFKTKQTDGTDIALVGDEAPFFTMNTSETNAGGWAGSYAYTTQIPASKALFPSDLQAVIKTTTLWTNNVGGGNQASNVSANSNEIYYLAEFEVQGQRTHANPAEQNYQKQYAYYSAGNSKIKFSDTQIDDVAWLLRSSSSKDDENFCVVYYDGTSELISAYMYGGFAPAFKV